MAGQVCAASNEYKPAKDTYISIGGPLGEETTNFGGANSIEVGDGLYGDCVGAIFFNLGSVPNDTETLDFASDVMVYGDETRTIKVFILLNAAWDELTVTGVDNPFNATNIWTAGPSEANCTTIQITGSTRPA